MMVNSIYFEISNLNGTVMILLHKCKYISFLFEELKPFQKFKKAY